ncbi:hypothetical protein GGR58DRAFT_504977 [Xylaria digitata]|nr:hypothetical protein GGR58DRAFT_504977 [Xylaria digitata]
MSQLSAQFLIDILQLIIATSQFAFAIFAWYRARCSQPRVIQNEQQSLDLFQHAIAASELVYGNQRANSSSLALPLTASTRLESSLPRRVVEGSDYASLADEQSSLRDPTSNAFTVVNHSDCVEYRLSTEERSGSGYAIKIDTSLEPPRALDLERLKAGA